MDCLDLLDRLGYPDHQDPVQDQDLDPVLGLGLVLDQDQVPGLVLGLVLDPVLVLALLQVQFQPLQDYQQERQHRMLPEL